MTVPHGRVPSTRAALLPILAAFTVAILPVRQVGAETLTYTESGSSNTNYNLSAVASQLIPFVDFTGSASERRVVYGSFDLPRFDAALGELTGVNYVLTGTGSTGHKRTGACESVLFVFACTFSIATGSAADFGIDIQGFDPGGPDPVIVGGLPSFPTADTWNRTTFATDDSWFFVGVETSPVTGSGGVNLELNPSASAFEFYSAGGTFRTFTEILSGSTLTLDCEIAVLALCEGLTNVSHTFSYSATVTYTYAPVPLPATVWLLAPAVGLVAPWVRRRRAAA